MKIQKQTQSGRQTTNPSYDRADRPSKPGQDIFKPGFVVISRDFMDNAQISLTSTQKRALEWTQRFSTGYCREWFRANLAQALKWSGLSRSPFFKARKELVDLSLIELRKDTYGTTWVRLARPLQPLLPGYIATLKTPSWPEERPLIEDEASSIEGHTILESRTAPNPCMKENPEKKKITIQQHASPAKNEASNPDAENVVVESIVIAQEPDILTCDVLTPLPAIPVTGDEPRQLPTSPDGALLATCPQVAETVARELTPTVPEAPPAKKQADQARRRAGLLASVQKCQPAQRVEKKAAKPALKVKEKNPLTAEELTNAEALCAQGVAVHLAERLARAKSSAPIARALADLAAQDCVHNPGGWLFEGLTSGRYDVELSLQPSTTSEAETVRAREHRPTALEMNNAERDRQLQERRDREREEADRERLAEQAKCETAEILAAWTPEEYSGLRVRAVTGLRGLALPEAGIVGAMVGIWESDQRRAAGRPGRG